MTEYGFDKEQLRQSDLDALVSTARECVYVKADNSNHWVVFYEIPNGRSVRISVTRTGIGLEVDVVIVSKDYVFSNNSICLVAIPLVKEMRVRDIIQMIKDRGRNRYEYATEETGCRWWQYVHVKDLADVGAASGDAVIDMTEATSYAYDRNGNATPSAMDEGKFF